MNGGRKHAKITHITLDYKTKSLLYIILKKKHVRSLRKQEIGKFMDLTAYN